MLLKSAHVFSCVLMCYFAHSQMARGAISCIQCSSVDDNITASMREACHRGQLPAQTCTNPNHTHCVTYWFKKFDRKRTTILVWRKCGRISDAIHPCKIHKLGQEPDLTTGGIDLVANSDTRKMVNLDSGNTDKKIRDEAAVEVCVYGCDQDACIPTSGIAAQEPTALVIYFMALLCYLSLIVRRMTQQVPTVE